MEQQKEIYQLYESNIGIIIPMIKEALDKAITEYPYLWIEHAVRLAVKNNARSWRYVDAILRRWKVDGYDGEINRRYSKKKIDKHDDMNRYAMWEEQ